MDHPLTIIAIAFCLSQSAMFSDLNLAFFSIGRLRLETEVENGNQSAARILALRKDANFNILVLWNHSDRSVPFRHNVNPIRNIPKVVLLKWMVETSIDGVVSGHPRDLVQGNSSKLNCCRRKRVHQISPFTLPIQNRRFREGRTIYMAPKQKRFF